MEPCWDGEAKWGVPHLDLTPGPHCLPAGLGRALSVARGSSPSGRGWPSADSLSHQLERAGGVQSCSERHLCKKNTIFFFRNGKWGWWWGANNADTVVRQDLVRGAFSQSWGHIKSPGADIQPSPASLVKITHRNSKAPAFPSTARPPSGTALSRPCLSVCGAP